ncbi:MAG: iron-sulfur cluster assembly accessory protein [Rickettsiales bacterium]|nr:iron-sulfur cluster assembly accessory protein [Rickettsiales bacterium]RPG13562.1 MAG: iron-sulfur cluster assembly accessory protein [Pelagibacteraceae bacterium TMED195]|tara:strand:+ start:6810 stop:7127 length:318 start_codon:yes stop_codon:yes gene_type:complete
MFDVSKSALKRIIEVSSKNKKKFFRISIDGGGCQGFSYKFDFDDKISEDDKVLDYNEVKILIDSTSLEFINDAKLDFVEDMIGSYFKISNPKATSTCGCGTSFSV